MLLADLPPLRCEGLSGLVPLKTSSQEPWPAIWPNVAADTGESWCTDTASWLADSSIAFPQGLRRFL
jgi:hypothetical protein